MCPITRDQAREDTAAYHRALITNDVGRAVAIEKRYELFGYPPQIVSIGLQAAAAGRDPQTAVEEYLEGEGE